MVENGFIMSKKPKIVITGGSGRFGSVLKKYSNSNFYFPEKTKLNILKFNSILKYLKIIKPKIVIHLAGLSRPIELHDKDISRSISLNIIGTANVVMACKKLNIKIIYLSTSYVYPGTKGNYKETDPLLPKNNYAWSKLGGESSVQMYKNSLIVRASMTEKPFVHKSAFTNMITNFIFHEEFLKLFLKVINKRGVINIGGPTSSVYKFAKKTNPLVKKIKFNPKIIRLPKNSSMNLNLLKKILKKKSI